MLKRWQLSNFKPIRGDLDLTLNDITVFAGLNSSGKSSILQSILLVSQTLSNPNPDKVLILNGPIVQLGTFEQLVNERASEQRLRIGFSLVPRRPDRKSLPAPRSSARSLSSTDHRLMRVDARLEFEAANQGRAGVTGIDAVKVVLADAGLEVEVFDDADGENRKVSASVKPLHELEDQRFLSDVMEHYLSLVPYPPGENYGVYSPGQREPMLTRLLHFLPHRLLRKFNVRDRRQEELLQLIDFMFANRISDQDYAHLHPRLVQMLGHEPGTTFRRRLNRLAQQESLPDFEGDTIASVLHWLHAQSDRVRDVSRLSASVKDVMIEEMAPDSSRGPHQRMETGLDTVGRSPFTSAGESVTAYFTTLIRYLGPLRADPHAAQGFAPSSEPDDVGYRGEYAASVFDANRHLEVTYWHPYEQRSLQGRLEAAMDVWLRYLGVGHHVMTREAGLSGMSWCIQQTPDSQVRPLHAVGIGVSQVLPILVAGLLAPQGATLLIEQPELHLHERAQARLGDFFHGLAQVGKQCLIETHSVCLINQLRYYVVKEGKQVHDRISLYFVEQDERGDARFTPVVLSPQGNILNWPDGFFDESALQEDLITRESIRLRASDPAKAREA